MSAGDDDAAVRNLVATLAQEADVGEQLDRYLACFCEDASWEMPGAPPVRGTEAIRAAAEERRRGGGVGPGSHTRHVITTQRVEVRGDEATSDSYFLFYTQTASRPQLERMGRYQDSLRRTGQGWKLARRLITLG